MARRKIADEEEITAILSAIARGDATGETVKVSERLKAAELLGRYYKMFSAPEVSDSGEIRVVVDYVDNNCTGSL